MRLTLRTLLAYLDDILEPEDREDIGNKVRESEFATTLVHRVRDVMQRPRLGSPQLIGTGMGRDPNSVAEYLDNTLAAEQIQLFEKVCLESDVHLAEVGASHHILTMILGEPAVVDPESRERMYELIETSIERGHQPLATAAAAPVAEAPTEAVSTAGVVATPLEPSLAATLAAGLAASAPAADLAAPAPMTAEHASTAAPPRRKPEVPEYLRDSTARRVWKIGLTAVGAALVTGIVLYLVNPRPINRLLGWNEPEQNEKQTKNDKNNAPRIGEPHPMPARPEDNDNFGRTPPKGVDAAPARPAAAADAGAVDTAPVVTPQAEASPVDKPVAKPVDHLPGGTPRPGNAPPVAPATPVDGPTAVPVPPIATPPVTPPAGTTVTPVAPPAPNGAPPKGDQLARVEPPTGTPPAVAGAVEPPAHVVIGRLLNEGQVLLRAAGKSDAWERVAKQAPLFAGDRLLVLPAFRPTISVGGVSLEMDGGTQLELGSPDAAGVPQITVSFGRLIARTLGQANARLRIHAGEVDGILGFGDAESKLAIEVRPTHAAGTDPEAAPQQRSVTLYAATGAINWTAGDKTTLVTAPRRLVLSGGTSGDDDKSRLLPGWIAAAEISPLDQRGTARIEQALAPDHGVKLTLVEQAAHPRAEVRNLATRSCAYVGHFEPLIKGLSDEEQRAGWMRYMAELRDAVNRDPQTAAAVRSSLEKLRRDKAPQLYRMLWGYSAAGLKDGDARRLIDYLDSDDLDFRVMSYWNLFEITGLGLNYRPEYTASQRHQSVVRWQKRLDERKIVPSTPAVSAPPIAPKALPSPPAAEPAAAPKAAPPPPAPLDSP